MRGWVSGSPFPDGRQLHKTAVFWLLLTRCAYTFLAKLCSVKPHQTPGLKVEPQIRTESTMGNQAQPLWCVCVCACLFLCLFACCNDLFSESPPHPWTEGRTPACVLACLVCFALLWFVCVQLAQSPSLRAARSGGGAREAPGRNRARGKTTRFWRDNQGAQRTKGKLKGKQNKKRGRPFFPGLKGKPRENPRDNQGRPFWRV